MQLEEHVDRWDMMIVAAVTIIVVTVNLVYAVGVGLIMACLRYAWENSQEFHVTSRMEGASKVYSVDGKLFFGSSMRFHTLFTPEADPANVIVQLRSPPSDYSGMEALAKVQKMYEGNKKKVKIQFAEPSFLKDDAIGFDDVVVDGMDGA